MENEMNQKEGGVSEEIQPQTKPSQGSEYQDQSSLGATVGIIIVIIVLILGGLYFWGAQLSDSGYNPADDAEVQELQDTNDSDEVNSIEADLEQDFEALDQDLEELDQELENI